jgi:hypothetical protein
MPRTQSAGTVKKPHSQDDDPGWDHDPEDDCREQSVIDPVTHLPRLLSRQCSTCVGCPGNLMQLRPGQLKMLIEENTGPQAHGLVCHQTLTYGEHPGFGPAFCRWFWDTYGDLANYIRIVKRLDGITEVDPPGTEKP